MGWLGRFIIKLFVGGRPNTYDSIPDSSLDLTQENNRSVVERTPEILCRSPRILWL